MGFNIQQYELATANNSEKFSNVAGDSADLENQLDALYEKRNTLNIDRKAVQREYDRYNEMKASPAKEVGKIVNAAKLNAFETSSDKINYAISTLEGKIEKVKAIEEAAKIAEAKKSGTYVEPISPIAPDTTKKSKTGMYIGIGVGVLAVGVVITLLLTGKK
jgi:outer membrane murein-binding lipoprotein Lpp